MDKYNELLKFSSPDEVYKKAKNFYGKDVIINVSTRKNKKYMIYDPNNDKWVHFGQMDYEDYTRHKDKTRRSNYRARASKLPGNWKHDFYSPNNLSINLLW